MSVFRCKFYTSLIKCQYWDYGVDYRTKRNLHRTNYNDQQKVFSIGAGTDDVSHILIRNGVKHLFIDGLNQGKSYDIMELFKLMFNGSNKVINFRSAIPCRLNFEQYEMLLNMIRCNYKVYMDMYIVNSSAYTDKLSTKINKYNSRNVRGWRLVYSAVICLLCIGRFTGLGSGWKDVSYIIARFVHSTRYEPCWYLT